MPGVGGQPSDARASVVAAGKFLSCGGEKLYVRGVTYGTFAPGPDGRLFPAEEQVERDVVAMARAGINAVRVYTSPPRSLLDRASEHGLRVMVGLSWEDHVAFLESRRAATRIVERVRAQAAECAGHPALLCFSVGNEIPATIVRWHGPRAIEAFIERLCAATTDEDPDTLVTYVNYPSTEYLELPFLDLACFNVFLESRQGFADYVARLHNVVGDRPLLLTEIGLDSIRHGEHAQARHLATQVRASFEEGCAGAFVFSWTDDWHRGGAQIDNWGFGVTNRARKPKPSLGALRYAFAKTPVIPLREWPTVSVIVCTHNGSSTIRDCLEGVEQLDYPDLEVIVVDDGSKDGTAAVAESFDVQLIRTANLGLSSARNTGIGAARGDIVAFLDDDSVPDRHWLRYLVSELLENDHAGVGGPNIPPSHARTVPQAIACGPGGPIHVLLTDKVAEHIPGCNMAFWKDALEEVGGFDPRFRVAGDDVDICWSLQERGLTLGFSAAAMVWHRSRSSLGSYLGQQRGYGRAEGLLERKWPGRYNRVGHLAWAGQVYRAARYRSTRRRNRIRYGSWGSNLFQSVYDRSPSTPGLLPLMPEWYLLIAALVLLSVYDSLHDPLLFGLPLVGVPVSFVLLGASLLALAVQATRAARSAVRAGAMSDGRRRALTVTTAAMYALQPLARLVGRIERGLTPWRRRGPMRRRLLLPRTIRIWSGTWRSVQVRLLDIESALRPNCMSVVRGGEYDRWDISVRVGPLAAARLRLTAEEHGHGRQLVCSRVWPRFSRGAVVVIALLIALYTHALAEGDGLSALILGSAVVLLALRATAECSAAMTAVVDVVMAHERDGFVRLPERYAVATAGGRRAPHLGSGGAPLPPEVAGAEIARGGGGA